MAKVIIKNPKQLEGYLANKLANELFFSSNLQDVMAETMQEVIVKNVYGGYDPKNPDTRRGNDDGFSDVDNMQFTSVDVSNGKVSYIFENTTEGKDSLKGQELADTFEEGIKGNWYNPNLTDDKGRVVSDARSFIEDTTKELLESGKLVEALKKDLSRLGIKIK